jgi:hypothetical protein
MNEQDWESKSKSRARARDGCEYDIELFDGPMAPVDPRRGQSNAVPAETSFHGVRACAYSDDDIQVFVVETWVPHDGLTAALARARDEAKRRVEEADWHVGGEYSV